MAGLNFGEQVKREPLMKWLLHRFADLKVNCDGCVSDYPPPVYIEVAGEDHTSTHLLAYGILYESGEYCWFFRDGMKDIEIPVDSLDEALQVIRKSLEISAHDESEAIRLYEIPGVEVTGGK